MHDSLRDCNGCVSCFVPACWYSIYLEPDLPFMLTTETILFSYLHLHSLATPVLYFGRILILFELVQSIVKYYLRYGRQGKSSKNNVEAWSPDCVRY
jgi:hypothetical protein